MLSRTVLEMLILNKPFSVSERSALGSLAEISLDTMLVYVLASVERNGT
jgi:hypothetical protein